MRCLKYLLTAALTFAPLPSLNAGWLPLVSSSLVLSVDGIANGNGGTTTQTLSLTTTKTNDIIILYVQSNNVTVSTVADVAGLTWARRQSQFSGGVSTIDEWWALSTGVLTSDVITVTYTGSASFSIATAFGVNGAKTSAPFDTNVSIPAGGSANPTFSTTASNTMVIAAGSDPGGTVPTGYTDIHHEAFWVVAENKFSSPQTSISVPWGGSANPVAVDAIVQGP